MKWNKLVKEETEANCTLDEKLKSKLLQLKDECKANERETLSDKNRFRVYGYEGQALHNFWMMMGRVIQDLSSGGIGKYTVEDLERALTVIYYPDRHKTPRPTDPRDIK